MPSDDVDKIIDDKDFHLLNNNDIALFLQRYRREDWKVDFKLEFTRHNGIVDKLKLCKHIVAFGNQRGGLIVYGVSNDILNPTIQYPDYVHGCDLTNVTPENLSSWIRSYISPVIYPTIKFFKVNEKNIVIIKVPPGTNKPYCYYDSTHKQQIYFRRSIAQVHILSQEETAAFYRECLLENARVFVYGSAGQAVVPTLAEELQPRISLHEEFVHDKIENTKEFGYLKVYCIPVNHSLSLQDNDFADFVEQRKLYSEALKYGRKTEVYQDRFSRGYYADAVRKDIKSSDRVTVYKNGSVMNDSQLDSLFRGDKRINLWWISYQIQRILQISYDVLHNTESEIYLYVNLGNLSGFFVETSDFGKEQHLYNGISQPIVRRIKLQEIFHEKENWNITMPVIKEIIFEVCKMFSLTFIPDPPWGQNDELRYASVFPGQR